MKPTSIATLALIALTGSASAVTFLGGAIETATNRTANTLPSSGNVGTVAVDGTAGVAAATFGFGAGAVVTQTAGTITGAMNMLSGTWNLQDGELSEITPVTTGLPTPPVGYSYHSFKAPSNPSLLTQSFMRLTMSPSN